MKLTNNFGLILLSIYLILVGIATFVALPIPAVVYGVLALAAGILILIGK